MPDLINPTQVYASFMQEIKGRLEDMRQRLDWIAHNPDEQAAVFVAEQTFLHTRFICELIALSSLSAHHSYGLNKQLLKAYRADNIFARLAEINAYCFPVPVLATSGPDGNTRFVMQEEGRLDSERLKSIYNQVDNALHRGRLKHAIKGEHKVYNLANVAAWRSELHELLVQHLIIFPEEERALVVLLDGDAEGRVKVLSATAGGPFVAGPEFAGS